MMIGWFRRTAPWQGGYALDMQHAVAVEETLANVRVTLVLVSLLAAAWERARPQWHLVVGLLTVLAIYSVLVALAVRSHRIRTARHVELLHANDTLGILALLVLTGGAVSPFSTLFLFVLLAAGYRWGRQETWLTTGAGIVLLALHAVAVQTLQWGPPPDGHITALRLSYWAVGGVLIGYMAETERVHRYRAWSVSRILSRVRSEAGVVAAVQAVLDELIAQFQASHAVLVLEEEGHETVSLWQAERRSESRRATIKLTQERLHGEGPYLFPVPAAADAWEVRRGPEGSRPEDAQVVVLNANGQRVDERLSAATLFNTPFHWQAAFCLSNVSGEGWKGRVFLFLPAAPHSAREGLRYLQVVVRQVGPALFNLYLQRRLQSRAGVVERARISRELHDGVIQSLIGIEMQLEVLRREAVGKMPQATAEQLVNIQRILGQEILSVRDLMHMLKPVEVDAKRLPEHLTDSVERFRHSTGIDARFACDVDEIDLSPRVCRELAVVVQEALANVRKHAEATSVVVRLGRCNGSWQLVVDDNGRGLDFEGYLTHEEVDARRKGPLIIKERVRMIGGRLGIHSQPGFGTRLEITIPGKHYA